MHKRIVGPLLAVLAMAGCGDSGTSPGTTGSFQATVSGEFSAELAGAAAFGIYHREGFGVAMQPTDATHLLGVGQHAEARPPVGTYEINDPETASEFFGVYLRDTTQGLWTFTSVSGELNITTSTPSRLEGWFHMAARGYRAGNTSYQGEVEVDGTFSATCAVGARCD
jgi:hypothetical protein